MNITQIRKDLCAPLAQLDGWNIYPKVREAPEVPFVMLAPDEPFFDPHGAMIGGLVELRFRLVIGVQFTDATSGQDRLDSVLSAGSDASVSILDLLYADSVALELKADPVVNYGVQSIVEGGPRFLGATMPITVYTNRT